VHLHPLDPSVKCQHCGKGDLEFSRTPSGRDLYRCVGEARCRGYMLHYRRDGKSCGVAAELHYGVCGPWVECAGRELAKGE
jgi:ssDNA-binding Zn-finger/Zn-ribbon topoisomerase 1